MTDWTDTRSEHDNPREGRRTKPGAIRLQAYDADTRIEYWNVLVGELE